MRRENAAYFEKFEPRYFMYVDPGSQETSNFEKYTKNPRGKRDELARQVTDVSRGQKHPILKGCKSFKKGELERDGKHMHFNAGAASQMMIMELIRSANDVCMLCGI